MLPHSPECVWMSLPWLKDLLTPLSCFILYLHHCYSDTILPTIPTNTLSLFGPLGLPTSYFFYFFFWRSLHDSVLHIFQVSGQMSPELCLIALSKMHPSPLLNSFWLLESFSSLEVFFHFQINYTSLLQEQELCLDHGSFPSAQ